MKKVLLKVVGGLVLAAELSLIALQIRELVKSLGGLHRRTRGTGRFGGLRHFFEKKHLVVLVPLLLLSGVGWGQGQTAEPRKWPLVVSIFNVGTQLPGSGVAGVFTTPIHPGLSVGSEYQYNKGVKNRWFQTARLGLLYHRLSQTAVQLYTEAGYRRHIWRGTAAEIRLGGGYLHSFTDLENFKLKNGEYVEKKNFGRAQAMAGGTFGLSYAFAGQRAPRVFLDYQFYLQMPFVKNYVPLLPNVALHAGVAFEIGN